MPDYIQLLESKLSPHQKQALNAITDVARARRVTVFLTGGAVRDIVSGASVRDLDITVQANPLKFKKDLEKAGFAITGEHDPSQTLYLRFGREARLEISGARTETFPKPARPEYHPASILGDLHRRDFTANAMALSLNEGSWGLLLDPLNGTADIYSRQLRLVNNYGFLEDPIRMARAVRLLARTGWEMEERTKTRYENAKAEDVIGAITVVQRGYELEEIAYEEEPLQIIKALEAAGWMSHLSPNWNSRSVDAPGIERLHERLVQLLMAGLHPDASAAQFHLLTARLTPAHLSALKRLFVRTDLIAEADALNKEAKKVLQQITSKEAAKSSQLWKLMHSVKPEAVLWLFFTGKGAVLQHKFENFFTKWPEARQKIPNAILQDMRILPDIAGYEELLDKLTFAFMDNELPTEESIRKFAEPYSPPPPPAPVVVRRSRAVKRVVEPRKKNKKAARKTEEEPAAAVATIDESEVSAPTVAPESVPAKVPTPKSGAKKSVAVPAPASKTEAKPVKPEKSTGNKAKPASEKPKRAPATSKTSTKPGKPTPKAAKAPAKPSAASAKTTSGKPSAKPKPSAKVSGPTHKAGLAARTGSKTARPNIRPAVKSARKPAPPVKKQAANPKGKPLSKPASKANPAAKKKSVR